VARGPITFSTTGHFNKTTAYLQKLKGNHILTVLNRHGSAGVATLQAATPTDTGLTRASWYYTVGAKDGQYWIDFHNSNMVGGTPVVILIQYGHATRNGGYVIGRDFINPALKGIFDQIKEDVWKEVSSV